MASHRKRAGESCEQTRTDIDRDTDVFFSKTMNMTWNNDYEVKGGCLSFNMRGGHSKLWELCQIFCHFLIHIHLNVRKNSRKGILNIQQGNQEFTLLTLLVNWSYIKPAKDRKRNRKWSWLQCRPERATAWRIGSICKGSDPKYKKLDNSLETH